MGLQKGAGNQHLRPGIEYHTSKMADHSRDTICATEQHLTPLCSVCRLLSQKKTIPTATAAFLLRYSAVMPLPATLVPSQTGTSYPSTFCSTHFLILRHIFLSNSRPLFAHPVPYPLVIHCFSLLLTFRSTVFDQFGFLTSSLPFFLPHFPPYFSADYFSPYSFPQKILPSLYPSLSITPILNSLTGYYPACSLSHVFFYHLASYSQTHSTGKRSTQVRSNGPNVHFENLDDLV